MALAQRRPQFVCVEIRKTVGKLLMEELREVEK